jgi:hypothetical protein
VTALQDEVAQAVERAERAEREAGHARERAASAAVALEAARRGVWDTQAAVALVDCRRFVFGDAGEPLNVLQVVDALIEAHPYLVSEPPKSSRDGVPPRGFLRMQQRVRSASRVRGVWVRG